MARIVKLVAEKLELAVPPIWQVELFREKPEGRLGVETQLINGLPVKLTVQDGNGTAPTGRL